jgi:hypothetical protein
MVAYLFFGLLALVLIGATIAWFRWDGNVLDDDDEAYGSDIYAGGLGTMKNSNLAATIAAAADEDLDRIIQEKKSKE